MDISVAHYRLLDRLGEGGLGEVFRARDTKVGRTVALKLLPRSFLDKPARRERFLADAGAAAALSHPNIATLFEVGEHEGRGYLAYEFVSGETLRQQVGGRPMNPRTALEIGVQLADALGEVHARGVLHGDLRPENVVITTKGSAKLLETGMAGWTRGGASRAQAAAGHADAATVRAYMPPEQFAGGQPDARGEVFALAVIVYEMLTGRPPSGPHATAAAARGGASLQDLPRDIDAILARGLARDPASRMQSAVSFGAELRSVAAMFDVRAGETVAGPLLPLDDEGGGAGKWWAIGGLALVGTAAWLYFR